MNHIYFVCSHITYLILYEGLSQFFGEYFPGVKRTLVLVENPSFSDLDKAELGQAYDFVHRVAYHETAGTRNWRKEYRFGAIRNRAALLREFLDDSDNFTFEEGSLFFITEMTETTPVVRLLIAKLRRETRQSVICRVGTCFHRQKESRTNNWLSWLENNIYVPLGAPAVSVNFLQWMIADRRFYREQNVVDHHLVFSNRWAEEPEYREVIYPIMRTLETKTDERESVLYMDRGTGALTLYPDMSVEQAIEQTSSILRALTELYRGEDVDLFIKPHPRALDLPYDLAGFEVFENKASAETVFNQGAGNIRAVYSPTSSTVRTASLFGIPSYIFLEMYGFPEEFENRVRRNLLDFSDAVNIRSLDELVLPPPASERTVPAAKEDLSRLADLFGQIAPGAS